MRRLLPIILIAGCLEVPTFAGGAEDVAEDIKFSAKDVGRDPGIDTELPRDVDDLPDVENDMGQRPMRFVQVEAGTSHACARSQSGNVVCWGSNEDFAASSADAPFVLPTEVELPGRVVDISLADQFSCAITEVGGVWCWGKNHLSQIDASGAAARTPTLLFEDPTVRQISAGGSHICVRHQSGSVECWGSNDLGQVTGSGPSAAILPSDRVRLMGSYVLVQTGTTNTCARLSNGGMTQCWGGNSEQESLQSLTECEVSCDRGPSSNIATPHQVVKYTLGNEFGCGFTDNSGTGLGYAYCWGNGENYRRGVDPTESATIRAIVPQTSGPTAAAIVEAGATHACAWVSEKLTCWGEPVSAIGAGADALKRADVDLAITDLTAGDSFTCATSTTFEVYCWGENSAGQLGTTNLSSPDPTVIDWAIRE